MRSKESSSNTLKKEIDEISQQCEKINHAFATMFAYCKDNEVNEETTQAVTDLYEKY